MYIKQVQLAEFKRHTALEVELSRGVNAICGPNGAGKSSIIEAIGFAIFNHCTYRSRNELIRKGAKRADVCVTFESPIDQCLYRVDRSISATGSNIYTVRDSHTGSLMADGVTDCQELLTRLLGAEEDGKLDKLFDTILGVPQGTITSAFRLTGEKRKSIFAPLLRVEEYEKAWSQIKQEFLDPLQEEHRQHTLELNHTKKQLAHLPQQEKEHILLCAAIHQAEEELAAITQRMPLLETRRDALQTQRDTLRIHEQKQLASQRKLEDLDAQRRNATAAFTEAQAAQEIIEETTDAYHLHLAIRPRFDALNARHMAQQQEREALQQLQLQRHQRQHELDQCTTAITTLHSQQERLTQLTPLVTQHQDAKRELDRLQQRLSTLPFYTEQLANLQLERNMYRANEAGLQRELAQLAQIEHASQLRRQLEDEGKQLREQRDTWKKEQSEREQLQQKIHQLQSQSQTTRTHLEQIQHDEANLRHQLTPLAQRLDEHDKTMRQLQQQLDRLNAQRERDTSFQKSVSGGHCPFFDQTCKNVPPGQRLDHYIQANIQRSDQEAAEIAKRAQEARTAREAALAAQRQLNEETPHLVAKIESEKREIERIAQQQRESQHLLQQVPPREQEVQRADQRLQQLREQFAQARADEEKAQALPALQESLKRLRRDMVTKEEEAHNITRNLTELEALKPRHQELQDHYIQLEQAVQEHRDLTRALQQLPSLREQHLRCEESLAALNSQLHTHQQQLQESTPIEEELKQLSEQLKQSEKAYTQYLQYIQIAQKLEERRTRLAQLEQRHQDECQEHQTQQSAAETLRASFSPALLQEIDGELRQLVHRNGELRGSLPKDHQQRDRLAAEINSLNAQQAALDTTEAAHLANGHMLECGNFLRRIIKEAGPHMTRTLIHSISAEADRLFRHLIDQNHLHLRWEESFELFIEEDGQERSFANLSGGEQMAAALAVRIALIKELSSIKIAFFDEPTAHLDAERRYNLASQLSQVAGFDQLVVISHDDTFENMTDNVVWIRSQ